MKSKKEKRGKKKRQNIKEKEKKYEQNNEIK